MDAINSPRMLVNIFKTTLYHVPEQVVFIVIATTSPCLRMKEHNGNSLLRRVVLSLKVVRIKLK
jgi:hypothetical protein